MDSGRVIEFCYTCTLPWDFFKDNINASLKRDTPRLFDVIKRGSAAGACAIVGGGPSLKYHLQHLREFEGDIFSCGTVHDYLIENGIVPKYHVIADPDVETITFITKLNHNITYLLASQCHQVTYDALKEHKVLMWHCFSPINDGKFITLTDEGTPISDFNGEESVRGGGSVVLRAYPLASLLGYTKFNFFGFDCSFPLDCDEQHAYDYSFNKEDPVSVLVDGVKYYSTPSLMLQLKTFVTYVAMAESGEFIVYGDSLVKAVCYRNVNIGPT